jgi:glycosyltransferase involved in cell wall biosynthesis
MYEYLAMDKPVICTALPGVMKEFGQDNGVIYVNRSEDVMKKVLNLTENDINLNKAKAKDFIKDYDWDKIITLFQEILGDLKQVQGG